MRNPLRRAYRQLSRLIINEGFKEFAKLCGFDTEDPNCAKDPDYQAVKNAYADIQSNPELKKFYKAKLTEDGTKNISNLDQALYDASYDEKLSRVEKFLADYKTYSTSYKQYFKNKAAKRRIEKQEEKDDSLKKDFAGNVVQNSSTFIVYEVDYFEEAKQMRWMWMGNVLKLSNEECKKIDPNAPGDAESYAGEMTPEQMAKYMMSNTDFIMNPSWCVCAGEDHWDSYGLGKIGTSCYLIFSKIYPNVRFCVVYNGKQFEIRDPWQGGSYGDGEEYKYGYEIMKIVFGEAVNTIECVQTIFEDYNQKAEQLRLLKVFDEALKSDDTETCLETIDKLDQDFLKSEDYSVSQAVIYHGNIELFKHMMRNGVDVNEQDEKGITPLHVAATGQNAAMCSLLLDIGADVEAEDIWGETPLHRAAAHRRVAICSLLLKHGADVNVKSKNGSTPLSEAAAAGSAETCKLLLDYGADINDKAASGKTPLHYAVSLGGSFRGNLPTCQLLVNYGADVNAKDNYGRLPLHSAASGKIEICRFLIENGSEINAKDNDGYTPLHRAAAGGHTEICKLLLDNGADVNAEKIGGETPLEMAMDYGHRDVCKLLRQYRTRG